MLKKPLAAHRQTGLYRVTTLHMGNGWVTPKPCLCAAEIPLFEMLVATELSLEICQRSKEDIVFFHRHLETGGLLKRRESLQSGPKG